MKYKCLLCKKTNDCPDNKSGEGICPQCTPGFIKKFGDGEKDITLVFKFRKKGKKKKQEKKQENKYEFFL